MCVDFVERSRKALQKQTISQKTVLENVEGEPSNIIYVAEPYSFTPELAMQDIYHTTGIGRLCVQAALVADQARQTYLIKRLNRAWTPMAQLAEVADGGGWNVALDARLLRRDVTRIGLLDYVFGNEIRHGWSIFLDTEGGRFLATDHGRCFLGNQSLKECMERSPIGDLDITAQEVADAQAWWMTVSDLAIEVLNKWLPYLGEEPIKLAQRRTYHMLCLDDVSNTSRILF